MARKTKAKKEKTPEKSIELKTEVKGNSQETQEENEGKLEDSNLKKDIKENTEKIQTHAEKVLDDIISTFKGKQEEFGKTISNYTTVTEKPLVDLLEIDESLILKVDLPNIIKDDVILEVTEESVEIAVQFEEDIEEMVKEAAAEEESDDDSPKVKYILKERSKGKIERSIPLPVQINIEEVAARFEGSVLIVDLPKIKEPRFKVDIN
ncbi:MAG: Hsp20/alpha crystallin family protein [Methanobacteriaceae archaeon]|nr:Hsp20/alpha crystallin family protein [Methanobacteriaceae archaeon]MDP2837238.1 Hsp20/alpha crystallin family protein [Methanobacteriaceae archaeon]MDP3034472.1 Hsp20/alpha crystallin family protein [Methanobacteriaceae archaeon]MDP3485139.1 Hsp20/alpha crystallin family protein [Methanobacteriaceae archaeon]MDP3623709.1 Hsp20/alpha crystallin family protein [Methanobacteriaceae archaeon]